MDRMLCVCMEAMVDGSLQQARCAFPEVGWLVGFNERETQSRPQGVGVQAGGHPAGKEELVEEPDLTFFLGCRLLVRLRLLRWVRLRGCR